MNIEDIAKEMARDGYNLKDDGANNRALKEYLQTLYVMDNDDYSVVEAYDLWAIQGKLEKQGDWTEADYWDIKDVVR